MKSVIRKKNQITLWAQKTPNYRLAGLLSIPMTLLISILLINFSFLNHFSDQLYFSFFCFISFLYGFEYLLYFGLKIKPLHKPFYKKIEEKYACTPEEYDSFCRKHLYTRIFFWAPWCVLYFLILFTPFKAREILFPFVTFFIFVLTAIFLPKRFLFFFGNTLKEGESFHFRAPDEPFQPFSKSSIWDESLHKHEPIRILVGKKGGMPHPDAEYFDYL